MKICTKCKQSKDVSNFTKNKKARDGLHYWCKDCAKAWRDENSQILTEEEKEVRRQKSREKIANRTEEERREHYLMHQHHWSLERYKVMYDEQNGKCKICKREPGWLKLYIDHDHRHCSTKAASCGECVRGLLCNDCNVGVSYFKDNPQYLLDAGLYIKNTISRS